MGCGLANAKPHPLILVHVKMAERFVTVGQLAKTKEAIVKEVLSSLKDQQGSGDLPIPTDTTSSDDSTSAGNFPIIQCDYACIIFFFFL